MAGRVHLVNPSTKSFGVAVITPRWLYVVAAATGTKWGDPIIVDESLDVIDPETINAGDVIGIGIHTGNARRGYEIGQEARARGAWVVFGGIHATLFPDEAREQGAAHAIVKGDGDIIWPKVVEDCFAGHPLPLYDGGRVSGDAFVSARWDLLPPGRYMWASVQTVRGCPKHCSFCSVWRTDGQEPRQRGVDRVVAEVVELRRLGFRFIALADDNFYPVTLADLAQARRRSDHTRLHELEAMRQERFELMEQLALLPDDMVFFTQITMEAAEDPSFLEAMRKARIKGALVGVESVTEEGLKDVYKGFNFAGDDLVARLQRVPEARGPRARVVHLRPAERSRRHVRFHGGARRQGGRDLRAVRAADAVSRHDRFREMGRGSGAGSGRGRWRPDHAALAHPGAQAAEALHPASDAVARGNPRRHARRVGSVLQLAAGLGPIARGQIAALAARVRFGVAALSADVREHGNRD